MVATKAATLVAPDASIRIADDGPRFVSRAGDKLRHALDRFDIEIRGRRAVDVGASTGGFTDCLLQAGAAAVCAVDVGYGQLHWSLRTDERVDVVERTNIRTADPAGLGGPFGVVVADLSFISLAIVAGQLVALGAPETDWIVLVKPQFEVGKDDVGTGGIVRDPSLWSQAMSTVSEAFGAHGLEAHGVDVSPVVGTKGNREFVVWYRMDSSRLDIAESIEHAVTAAGGGER